MRPLDSEHPTVSEESAEAGPNPTSASVLRDEAFPRQRTAARVSSPETAPDDADAPIEVQEVGVLFVHGMGKHQRGDFLRQIGEPLFQWMAAWIGHGDIDAANRTMRARESSLRVPHLKDNGAPAHSVVETVVTGTDGRRRRITWVAVDGWWTDEVVEPTFSQVASWGLGLAPWMIVRYFRRHWRGILLLPSLVIVVLFQLLILTLSVFGAVPKLRSYVTGLQLRIAGSIGDVMVMVANPLQFNAMTTRIVSDLQWLQEQVPEGRIAVVAHSQGTGLAHAALQASHVPVDLLVTYGTALEKLHVARQIQQNPRRLAIGSTLTIAGGVLLTLAAGTAFKMNADDLTANASMVGRVLMGAGAILLMARMGLWYHLRRLDGILLTIASIAILLAGFVMTAASWTGGDRSWRDALRTMTVSRFWNAWTDSGWHRFALGFLVAGVLMVLVRECAVLVRRPSTLGGEPDPNPGNRPIEHGGLLAFILDPGSAVGNLVGAAAIILALFGVAMATPPDQSAEANVVLLLLVTGLAFCFSAVPLPIARVAEPTAADLRIPRREGRMLWHNYWASADPVPDGNLPIDTTPYVTNHEVRNRGSVLEDHTTYTENGEEFLSDLALHLSDLAGWPAIHPDDALAIQRAQRRRIWRVGFLTADRWMASVGMVATWWILGAAGLTVIGEPLASVIGYFAGILPGLDSESVQRGLPESVLGMVMVMAIAIFWYRGVLRPAWRYWDTVEAEVLARREHLGRALVSERSIAAALFAFASAIGLCAAIWSPNLVKVAIDLPRVLPNPELGEHDHGIALIAQWPWQRDALLHSGLWGASLPTIGIVTIAVTILLTAVIQASIRANSRIVVAH